ncbi:MAG: hypothetical protein MUF85_02975 [Patescibacteria group bacterium]|nr:hypothetical protein [Patescibacteria group bacterium]
MKPVLFIDFDGTLCFDRFWRSLDSNNYQKIQKYLFYDNSKLANDWMRGLYSSEQINKLISKKLNLPYDSLWELFVNDCKNMNVPQSTLVAINKLKSKWHTVLITDNMDCFTRFTVPAINLDKYFDLIVDSYINKKLKKDNNGQVFIDTANKLRVKLKDCTLIDDSKNACLVFTNLGGRALTVTSEKPVDYWLRKID